MSIAVEILSKDAYIHRADVYNIIAQCPAVTEIHVAGKRFILTGGGEVTIDYNHSDKELCIDLWDGWYSSHVNGFKKLYDWLCNNTTWDLELDWSEAWDETIDTHHTDIYRASQTPAT